MNYLEYTSGLSYKEKEVLKECVKKYNLVLKEALQIALAEDLKNLIATNRHDEKEVVLNAFTKKAAFRKFVMNEFLRQNTSPICMEPRRLYEDYVV
jgi:hypothetical protein